DHALEGWAWLAAAAWALIPNPYPWYGTWLVAVAALAPRTRSCFALILLSLAALLRYAPDAVGVPSTLASVALAIAATLPFVVFATQSPKTRSR
ncbi:MAG: hypothetical protein JO199_03505, partial [Candidatus Eremiobacteraeota bacterium]|nr:hypothetical protein [Candidatus Eremiobacteraeota bacterium]